MSHQIILGKEKGSGHLVAVESTVSSEVVWTPSHELSPKEERRRIEKGERMLADLVAMLEAPEAA